MHKLFFLGVIFLLTPVYFIGQQVMSWKEFADISFHDVYNVHYDDYFKKPTFGPVITSYEGSMIKIKGYFLDLSSEEAFFMVSKNPMSSCFFCGGAGPETIIEVIFKEKPSFKTDQIIEVSGILKLNTEDVDHCNYILENATAHLIQ